MSAARRLTGRVRVALPPGEAVLAGRHRRLPGSPPTWNGGAGAGRGPGLFSPPGEILCGADAGGRAHFP